ncbi:hypothetical protein [Pararhizobium sp. DWP1-1-3]|uniref:hypothetical protein n=1 Tax=Pararhizobium sp. DWP1-1-3 TaxID=2804652 RepID=UPI003CEEEC6A
MPAMKNDKCHEQHAVGHVTRAGANIFTELGFDDEEAHRLNSTWDEKIAVLLNETTVLLDVGTE